MGWCQFKPVVVWADNHEFLSVERMAADINRAQAKIQEQLLQLQAERGRAVFESGIEVSAKITGGACK